MKIQAKKNNIEELLKKLLIAQLASVNVPQKGIREVVGVDMNYINRIVKYIPKNK